MPLYIVAAGKDVDMLADVALLIENAVAKCDVLLPERVENIADRCKIARQTNLDLAIGKWLSDGR